MSFHQRQYDRPTANNSFTYKTDGVPIEQVESYIEHFKSELRSFTSLSYDTLSSKSHPYGGLEFGYLFKMRYFCYCSLILR